MALEIKLTQKLSQTLVMTPQLQQAIKLLQLGRQEYLEVLERECLENPFLEEQSERDPAQDSEDRDRLLAEREQRLEEGLLNYSSESQSFEDDSEVKTNATDADYLVYDFSAEAGEYYPGGSRGAANFDSDERSLESTLRDREGLDTFLASQLGSLELEESEKPLASYIIGNLDVDGYLLYDLDDLARDTGRKIDEVQIVLRKLQTLEPAGVAARNLTECLLIQLDDGGMGDSLAARILRSHAKLLEGRRFDLIAKAEGVELADVQQAVKQIAKLNPRPGRQYNDDDPIYVTPDIFVRKVDDDYVVVLNDSGIPRLGLSAAYRSLLSNGARPGGSEGRDFIQERLRSANWLLRVIEQRRTTIFKVAKSIVRHQRDFFDLGVQHLKPLVLRDIAADVGMHESTVSRVTTNKYMFTPQGVFELKYFFTSGIRSAGGDVSSEAVKQRIAQIVREENQKRPLSDQAIANLLEGEGFDIARRTVAKYREMLGVLPSSKRKRMF